MPRVVANEHDERAQLVQRFLDQGRAALLLRFAIADSLAVELLAAIRQTLNVEMAAVATGSVFLTDWSLDADPNRPASRCRASVTPYLIDRTPVTNARFSAFVDDGGYHSDTFWEPAVWPRVVEFVDRTNTPGPRFWSRGKFAPGTEMEPVVGVSWFEADAFARWSGKRLPTDPEWVKVATCPTQTTTGEFLERRFPWGEMFDDRRANVWISGKDGITSVAEQSVNGSETASRQPPTDQVEHLIGNVWEWTAGDLIVCGADGLRFESPIKSLRGGAFDSYFEQQVSGDMQSGDSPWSRRHNVGFRCAISTDEILTCAELIERSSAGVGARYDSGGEAP